MAARVPRRRCRCDARDVGPAGDRSHARWYDGAGPRRLPNPSPEDDRWIPNGPHPTTARPDPTPDPRRRRRPRPPRAPAAERARAGPARPGRQHARRRHGLRPGAHRPRQGGGSTRSRARSPARPALGVALASARSSSLSLLVSIGGMLFLGEWLFGSIGWGVLLGTELLLVGVGDGRPRRARGSPGLGVDDPRRGRDRRGRRHRCSALSAAQPAVRLIGEAAQPRHRPGRLGRWRSAPCWLARLRSARVARPDALGGPRRAVGARGDRRPVRLGAIFGRWSWASSSSACALVGASRRSGGGHVHGPRRGFASAPRSARSCDHVHLARGGRRRRLHVPARRAAAPRRARRSARASTPRRSSAASIPPGDHRHHEGEHRVGEGSDCRAGRGRSGPRGGARLAREPRRELDAARGVGARRGRHPGQGQGATRSRPAGLAAGVGFVRGRRPEAAVPAARRRRRSAREEPLPHVDAPEGDRQVAQEAGRRRREGPRHARARVRGLPRQDGAERAQEARPHGARSRRSCSRAGAAVRPALRASSSPSRCSTTGRRRVRRPSWTRSAARARSPPAPARTPPGAAS